MYGLVLKTLKKGDKLIHCTINSLQDWTVISSLILSSGFPIFRLSCLKHILTDLHAVLVQNTTLSFAQKAWVSFLKFIIPRPHVSGPCFELPVCMSEKSLCFWSIEYIISWYFAFLGVYGPNSTSALDPFLLPEREAKDHRICENNPKCVLYWHEGLGGGKDGWGWMDEGLMGLMGLMGLGSLLQVVRDMMEYDGIWWCETRWNMMVWNKGFRPLDEPPVCWEW